MLVESKSSDIILFHQLDNLELITQKLPDKNEIYNKDETILLIQRWKPMGYEYGIKYFSFIQRKDTMNIKCSCGQERNYYFRNFEFKRGNFELSFDYGRKYNEQSKKYEPIRNTTFGSEIKVSKKVQNILFKNTYTPREEITQQDLLFKDLLFREVDLKDTVNVHLKKID